MGLSTMIRKIWLGGLLGGALLLSGCAQPPRSLDFLRPGTDIDAVRYQIGMPLDKIIDLPNGNKMWTFVQRSSQPAPVTTQSFGGGFGPYGVGPFGGISTGTVPVPTACTVQVETSAHGAIVQWRRYGQGCR